MRQYDFDLPGTGAIFAKVIHVQRSSFNPVNYSYKETKVNFNLFFKVL
jgi:hypothetical protein